MKKIISNIFLLLLAFFIIAGCDSGSSDWVKYKNDNDGNVYSYNKGNIKTDSANQTVQVLAKEVYSDAGKTIELQARIKDGLSIGEYDKFSYKTCLYEIDCKKQKISVLSISHYDKDGKVIYSGGDTDKRKWFDINPDSTGDTLQKEVCPK